MNIQADLFNSIAIIGIVIAQTYFNRKIFKHFATMNEHDNSMFHLVVQHERRIKELADQVETLQKAAAPHLAKAYGPDEPDYETTPVIPDK